MGGFFCDMPELSHKLSAVLFDLDGTLVDSLEDIANAMNHTLAANGWPEHPVADYRMHVGDGVDMLAYRTLPAECREDTALREEVVNQMKRRYSDRWYHRSRPYPGIPELLRALGGMEVRIGVLSNKPDEFTEVMVEHFFPDVVWHNVLGAMPGIPVKPAPDSALAIAKDWGLKPETILYVGDTRTDVLTAKNAGMPCAGVTWGFRDREELAAHGADAIFDEAEALLAFITANL